jgi:hypothetical protein
LLIQLENKTPVSVSGVQVQLGERIANGRVSVRAEYKVPGKLEPGQRIVLKSEFRLANARLVSRWAGRVVRAVIDDR